MRSLTALVDLTLKGQIQGHPDFQALYLSRKGAYLDPKVLI